MSPAAATGRDWHRDLLAFWFEELDPKAWFRKDAAVDRQIRERFLSLHERIAAGTPVEALSEAQPALAAVIALDQLPRNMFRASPRAFATDAQALELARHAVAAGLDGVMTSTQRLFLYLPFEHAESLPEQERAVALIGALGDRELTRYAVAHRDIIARFGRFPHRNDVLGRASTPEELEFLTKPGSSF